MELVRQGVTTAMDVSDGLIDDLRKICEMSKVGAVIKSDCLPVDSYLRQAFPCDWLDFAQFGGEDYELLFTAPTKNAKLIRDISKKLNLNLSRIGSIVNGRSVRLVDSLGQELTLKKEGFSHF